MELPKLNQNRLRRSNFAVMWVALAAIIVGGGSIMACVRWQAIRERWLKSQSIETLRSLDARTDADTLVHFALASRMVSEGKPEEARSAAADAAKSVPDSDRSEIALRLFALLAYLDAKTGKHIDADSALASAEHVGGDDVMIHVARGLLASDRKDLTAAIAEFTRATILDPQLAEAWSRLASAFIEVAEPEEAMGPLRKAVEITPNDPQVHADLAEGLGRLAQYDEAAKECALAVEFAPNNPTFAVLPAIARASSARTDRDYERAVQMLTADIQRFPQVDFLHELLAGLHARFGEYARARAELQPYLARNTTDSGGWLNLSLMCERMGDVSAASTASARYQHLLDIDIAPVKLTQQALLRPNDPNISVKLSAAYHRAGKLREAYRAMLHAGELRPIDSKIARAITDLQYEMNQTADPAAQSGNGPSTP